MSPASGQGTPQRAFPSLAANRRGQRERPPLGVRGCAAVLLLATAGAPAARAYWPARYGGQMAAPLPDPPVTLDPARMTRLGEWQLALLLYDTLFRQERQGSPPAPHLATGLRRLGRARRTVLLSLRIGVRTHAGRVLSAAAVAASLQRLRAGPLGWILATVQHIGTAGQRRLRLRLRRACPELEQVLAALPASIVIPAAPRRTTAEGTAPLPAPDGTGAYRLTAAPRPGPGGQARTWVLSAYAGHFAGRPFLDRLLLHSYPRAQDERAAFSLRRTVLSLRGRRLFGKDPPFAVRSLASPAVTTVVLLPGPRGPATRRALRQALYLAIQKQRLRQLVTDARTRPAHGPIPPVLRGRRARRRARSPAPFDPNRARQILARLAADPGLAAARDAGGRLRLTLLVDRSRPEDLAAARKIMADLWNVGVRLVVVARAPHRFAAERRAGRFDLALDRVTAPVLRSRYHLAALWAAAGDAARARRIVADLHSRLTARSRAFMRTLPVIPLFHRGIRVHLDGARARLALGPWGLVDWANAARPARPVAER